MERLNTSKASRVAFALGKAAQRAYPAAYVIKNSAFDKEMVCRIARVLGLGVNKHNGAWYENGRMISDIVKTEY